jgi:hypothetical protein
MKKVSGTAGKNGENLRNVVRRKFVWTGCAALRKKKMPVEAGRTSHRISGISHTRQAGS